MFFPMLVWSQIFAKIRGAQAMVFPCRRAPHAGTPGSRATCGTGGYTYTLGSRRCDCQKRPPTSASSWFRAGCASATHLTPEGLRAKNWLLEAPGPAHRDKATASPPLRKDTAGVAAAAPTVRLDPPPPLALLARAHTPPVRPEMAPGAPGAAGPPSPGPVDARRRTGFCGDALSTDAAASETSPANSPAPLLHGAHERLHRLAAPPPTAAAAAEAAVVAPHQPVTCTRATSLVSFPTHSDRHGCG